MIKLPAIVVALVLVTGFMTPQPANAWVWFAAKHLVTPTPTPKPKVLSIMPRKDYAKPMRQRSPDRYPDSERESRYKRF